MGGWALPLHEELSHVRRWGHAPSDPEGVSSLADPATWVSTQAEELRMIPENLWKPADHRAFLDRDGMGAACSRPGHRLDNAIVSSFFTHG